MLCMDRFTSKPSGDLLGRLIVEILRDESLEEGNLGENGMEWKKRMDRHKIS
jgi:hypothetical protein